MKNFQRLFAVLHKWKGFYLLSSLLMVVSIAFRMFEPKVLQVAIDGVIAYFRTGGEQVPEAKDSIANFIYQLLPALSEGNLIAILLSIAGIYAAIALMRGTTMFAASAIAADSTEKAIKRLRDNLFAHLQRLPISFHTANTTGEMIQRCTGDVDTVKKFIGTQVVDVIFLVGVFSFAFYMMAIVHLQYALIAVCVVPFIFLLSFFFFKKESDVWEKHEKEQDKLTSIVEEDLGGIRVVKAFAQEEFEKEKFEKQNQTKFNIGIKHVNLHALYWPISDMLFHLQITISIFAGGYFTLMNQITVGELAAFYSYIVMVGWPMRRIGRVISQMSMATVAVERLSKILDAETEDYTEVTNDITHFKGDITFKNVWFKYPETEEWTLQDVSFNVTAGDTVALIGPTGAGKSTIIALLTRFYEPTKGHIYIDGKDIKEYSKVFLRKRIGTVLQKAFLFSTTIKNNIAYTQPTAKDDLIKEAALASDIHHIMHVFPHGYDTIVGEKGVTLSGGQKQRVALARTLLETPDILVLDDATSAVDTETEYKIQQALQGYFKNKTTFIIAQRITSIQHASMLIVLDKGKVVQMGSPQTLIQQEGFFKDIYEVQISIEKDIT